VLDHSLILYGGGMGNPQPHATDPLPLLAVGGGVGRGNRYVELPRRTPIGNLWLTVARQYGSSLESFGDSTGTIDFY
jgi:hypothetical protein